MKSILWPVVPILLAVCQPLRADGPFTAETPASTALTSLGALGTQSLSIDSEINGGAAIASDASGNFYHATGPKIAKYNSAGVLQWSQSQSAFVLTTGSAPLIQNNYYDRWTDDQGDIDDIQLGSGFYEGDLANLYAQRIILDTAGDVYVNFLDLGHRDRSVVGKFDGATGAVEWVGRVGEVPQEEAMTNRYFSELVGFAVLPDQSVAVIETGMGSSRHAFTRLVIFASAGSSRNGVRVASFERVFFADGDTSFRNSIGVGMDVAADGTIYYATYEGVDPAPNYPTYPDTYPAPDTLVLRKLASPYTGAPTVSGYTTNGAIAWNDLELGPGGKVYTLGTGKNTSNRRVPLLAGFDTADFSADLLLTTYASPDTLLGSSSDLPGIHLFSTGTASDDHLYLTTGKFDPFKELLDGGLQGGFRPAQYGQNPRDLFVTKVDATGDIVWQKHEYGLRVYDAFTDVSDNLYFLGHNYEGAGISFYKYSPSGKLQVATNINAESGNTVDGRFTGLIDSDGDIALGFPQLLASGNGAANSRIVRFTNPANVDGATIDFPEFSSSAFAGQVIPLSATASNGQPVSFHITLGGDLGYISGSNLVLQRSGLMSVQAFQQDGSNFLYSETRFLLVNKRTQTITFNLPPSQKFKKGKKIPLGATATSGLAVTYTSSNGNVTIRGKNAIMNKKGKVTITAKQVGTAIYSSAAPVAKTIKIN